MCGHGIIAVTKVVLETGMLPVPARPRSESTRRPGWLPPTAHVEEGVKRRLPQRAVVCAGRTRVEVPGLGAVRTTWPLAGPSTPLCRPRPRVDPRAGEIRQLIDKGMAIKRAVMASRPITHPFEKI